MASTSRLCFLLGFLPYISYSYLMIESTVSGNTWEDTPGNYDPNCCGSNEDFGGDPTIDEWYNPNYDQNYANELGDQTTTYGGLPTWGFWSRTNQDSVLQMTLPFYCRYYGSVRVSWDVIIQRTGSTPSLEMERFSTWSGAGQEVTTSQWSSSWQNLGNNYYKKSEIQTFDTLGWQDGQSIGPNPPDLILLTVSKLNQNNGNRIGLQNLKIKCTKVNTPSPTVPPTPATGEPTPLPSKPPTPQPTDRPSENPTPRPTQNPVTARPSESPITLAPTSNPSVNPTPKPTFEPTVDPTNNPTEKPSPGPVRLAPSAPTTVPSTNGLFETLGGNGGCDPDAGFMTCNMQFVIVTIVLVIVCVLYWILGSVWYKRRQNNRPLPPHLMINKETEMQGTQQHATANKWKSDWELEQEAKAQQQAGGDAVMATQQDTWG